VVEQALQARFIKKYGKKKDKNLPNDMKSRKNSKNHYHSTKKDMDNKYYGKTIVMKEVQCYNYRGFIHFARNC
jgi:hypothetical protein